MKMVPLETIYYILFDFTVAGVKRRVAAVNVSPYYIMVHIIFCISFVIIGPILVTLKVEYRLSRCYEAYITLNITPLYMKTRNKTESPIFFCVFLVSNGSLSDFHCPLHRYCTNGRNTGSIAQN